MVDNNLEEVLSQYGMKAGDFVIRPFGSGYIHRTYKLEGSKSFILQRVNKNVFKDPDLIAQNIRTAADYLAKHHPDYNFTVPVPTVKGGQMAWDKEGFPWRIFRFIENTYTVDHVETAEQAFIAAQEFARLSVNLAGCDITAFGETIKKFHDFLARIDHS